MKTRIYFCAALFALVVNVTALSRSIGRDIEFAKDFDRAKAEPLLAVIRDERFKFIDGLVSYWPPDWATRLSYQGDSAALSLFLDELRKTGFGLRVKLYKGRDDETRRDTAWQLDLAEIQFPVWQPQTP